MTTEIVTAPAEATRPAPPAATPFGLLRSPHALFFGAAQRAVLGRETATLGQDALVCTDARLASDPQFAAMVADLEAHGVQVTVWSDTAPELPTGSIDSCYAFARTKAVDVVVGVGGGTCIDMAKAVALLLSHGGPLEQYYGEAKVPGAVLPIVAVPTTAGTGSEVTPVCVVSDSRRELKTGISSPHLVPTVSICDPELTLSCPPALTASVGADALTHLVESFTAVRRDPSTTSESRVFIGKNVISDNYCRWGLQLLGRSLVRVFADPTDAAARSDVMLAATAGGFALGVAGTAAAHALQYPLGAMTHSPHGVGVGVLLPYVMRYNVAERLPEFGEIARLLGVTGPMAESDLALAGVEAVERILTQIGIPKTLAELGLGADQLDDVARLSLASKRLVENNPRPLGQAEMLEITQAAFAGDRSTHL
ncbi:MAG: iron-containing alcohol dehydrogenase [Propionibacteriaceae bacterium]